MNIIINRTVNIKGAHNSFLSATTHDNVIWVPQLQGQQENWRVIDFGNSLVGLQSCHGTFLSAFPDGTVHLQDHLKTWEKFTLIPLDAAQFALQSEHKTYIQSSPEGNVKFERHIQSWEKFYLYEVGKSSDKTTSGAFVIYNQTDQPLRVFVSKYTNNKGSDAWYTLNPGKNENWKRSGWEFIAIEFDDKDRKGFYLPCPQKLTIKGKDNVVIEDIVDATVKKIKSKDAPAEAEKKMEAILTSMLTQEVLPQKPWSKQANDPLEKHQYLRIFMEKEGYKNVKVFSTTDSNVLYSRKDTPFLFFQAGDHYYGCFFDAQNQ